MASRQSILGESLDGTTGLSRLLDSGKKVIPATSTILSRSSSLGLCVAVLVHTLLTAIDKSVVDFN
jgi:hypothetical protein